MIFGTTATHALRALAVLAADEGEAAVLGRDLAGRIGVPSHYLAKVLAVLARGGLLAASRGARGGYRLARPPERITLLEIVEPFEGKRVRPACLLHPDRPCRDSAACSAHAAWTGVKTAYTSFLETTRLSDIQGSGIERVKTARRRRRGRSLRHRAARAPAGASASRRRV
jgi:Rrf2 family cysteine metabolism transcriptional repressor